MEITVAGQTWLFLLSVALGAALGVCYDVFRILRIAFRHPSLAVLLEDILFSLAAAGATFAFLLTTATAAARLFPDRGAGGVFPLPLHPRRAAHRRGQGDHCGHPVAFWADLPGLCGAGPAPVRKDSGLLAKIMKQSAKCIKNKAKNSRIPLKKHSHLLYNLKKRLQWDGQKKNVKEQEQPGS